MLGWPAAKMMRRERLQDGWQLQSDHDEDQAVEQEDHHFPEGLRLQTHSRAHHERRMPPRKNSGGDRREHSGKVEPFRGQIRGEWREQ